MSYYIHHAIVVTISDHGDDHQKPEVIHQKAKDIFFEDVSSLIDSKMGYFSFLIGPDGSKELWPQSDEGDAKREQFISYLEELPYDDGSSPVNWVEIQYGGDKPTKNTKIVNQYDYGDDCWT